MTNKSSFNIELRPSRYFFTLISGLHLVVLLIACISGLPWWILIILLGSILLSYFYLVRKYVYRKSKSIVLKLWQVNSQKDQALWQLQFKPFRVVNARLKPKGYSSDYLVILYFDVITSNKLILSLAQFKFLEKLKYKTISVLIFPDMVDYSCYVALRRYLNGY